MRRTLVFVVPFFLGGCLAPAWHEPPPRSGEPPSAEARSSSDAVPSPGRTAEKRTGHLALQPKEKLFPDAAEYMSLSEEPSDADVPEELPDPETLVDNFLLSGVGESPPEDEGETVAADEISFDFPVVENEKVHYYINYYTGTARHVFARWLERSGRYLPLMRSIFEEEGLPLDLTYLALVESGFNVRAYSWAHAAGPWQFIQSTGKVYGLQGDWWRDERRDFEKSTRAAARFLKHLYERFDGDWYLAVASYNCGPGRIDRAIERAGSRDFWELSRRSLIPAETRNYVPKLLATLLIAKQPEQYGFTDISYLPPLSFEYVTLSGPTDLEVVAKLCQVSVEEVKGLNPELKRWCTPPGVEQYRLRVPAGKGASFEEQYAALSPKERVTYLRHKIRQGDTLIAIAHRYGAQLEEVLAMNRISNPRALRIGDELILPVNGAKGAVAAASREETSRGRKITYKVKKGDTLWDIARQFGVSEKELRDWNGLGRSSTLQIGQTLTLSAPSPSSARVVGTSRSAGNKGAATVYQVRSGDSLWSIATRFGVTTEQLRSWNRLSKSHVLRPGDKLTIGPLQADKAGGRRKIVYQVKPGDTLWDIGRRHDVATREIMDWNDLGEDAVLRPGDQLTLLVRDGHRG